MTLKDLFSLHAWMQSLGTFCTAYPDKSLLFLWHKYHICQYKRRFREWWRWSSVRRFWQDCPNWKPGCRELWSPIGSESTKQFEELRFYHFWSLRQTKSLYQSVHVWMAVITRKNTKSALLKVRDCHRSNSTDRNSFWFDQNIEILTEWKLFLEEITAYVSGWSVEHFIRAEL
jgi:hypothetical protein